MADLQPIQMSFESGEISPKLLARGGTERYGSGVLVCENFLPASHGPLEMRGGRQFIAKPGDLAADEDVRLFGLDINLTQNFVVSVGGSWVQVFDRDGPIYNADEGVEHIVNAHFTGGLSAWVRSVDAGGASAEWDEKELVLLSVAANGDSVRLYQAIPVVSGTQYDLRFDVSLLPFSNPTAQVKVRVGASDNSSEYADVDAGPGYNQLIQFTPTVTTAYVIFSVTGAAAPLDVQSWEVDRVSVRKTQSVQGLVRFSSPYANVARDAIFVEPHPTLNALTLWHPDIAPYQLEVDASNNWTFAAITFTSPPAEWVSGNYPLAAAFFQGRLWAGGTLNQPTTFWGSKSGDYYNFTGGTNADDAVQFSIAKKGRIAWLTGAKNLVIGTEFAEYIVTSEGGVIIPGDIDVEQQSSYGSLAGQIVELGREVVYVSSSEEKVRTIAYQWTEDSWVSQDLAWPSEHIPKARIKEMVYAGEPDQIIWMVDRLDQSLFTCSYNREQRIVGWARHPTPAKVLSVATTKLFGNDEVWVLAEYETSGGPAKYIERYTTVNYLEGHVTVAGANLQNSIPGFDHLEGVTVGVVTDDAIHPDVQVVGGTITLQYPANKVVAGPRYTARMVTMPIEGGAPWGTQQGVMKRYSRIFVRLVASIDPVINGVRPPDRTPVTPMDTREPELAAGDVEVYNEDWDRTAQVTVEQDLPFATQIVGLFGELQPNKR